MKHFKYLMVVFFSLTLTISAWAETLKVGLYPYVPRVGQFEKALEAKWAELDTGIDLEIITDPNVWDGGYDKMPTGLDVFVFDALFLNKYRTAGLLESLESDDINPDGLDDFLHYAIEGVKNSTTTTYAGIPMFACTNVLFYKDSLGIEKANTFDEVRNIVKTCQFTGRVPGQSPHNGMMLDISGKTTNATYYVVTQYAMNGIYPFSEPASINSEVTNRLRTLMTMSSYLNCTNGNLPPYQRGIWFGQRYGNSFVGFTESMWGMAKGNNDELPTDFGFKPLPLWNVGETTNPVFYVDVIGVNANSHDVANAKKLAALLGSKDVVVDGSTGVKQPDRVPQYLLLTLKSAYDALAKLYPVYNEMKTMASNPNIKMFTLSDELYGWFDDNKSQIRTNIRTGFNCGSDMFTKTYLTSANAYEVCTPLCESQGGWNGQWTTAYPYVPEGYAGACGCNASAP